METSAAMAAFDAAREFADGMISDGRDVYGPIHSPLFVGQLHTCTRRIPAGTPADPGLFSENRELAGCGPHCQNLLYDLGLLDVLRTLSRVTGEGRYETAWFDYLSYLFGQCRHPDSGYIPWGDHVGFDVLLDTIRQGDFKGCHEVKVARIPWDTFRLASPRAVEHEIEVALFDHVCDVERLTFNRHANMDGSGNRGVEPCSLSSSAGTYVAAWAWLYGRTGERKLLNWIERLSRLYWESRDAETGLFPTGEDRPDELWYADVLDYSCSLLDAAEQLGEAGGSLRKQAVSFLHAYARTAWDPDGPGFFDTLNIRTGKPVVGASKHYPDIQRPRHLQAWRRQDNSVGLVAVATSAGNAYAATGDAGIQQLFDRALVLLDIQRPVREGAQLVAGDAAGVILALVHAARRGSDDAYLEPADRLVRHCLATGFREGLPVSGVPGGENYYAARAGSNDLAAAFLAYALARQNRLDAVPPIRHPLGAMPW